MRPRCVASPPSPSPPAPVGRGSGNGKLVPAGQAGKPARLAFVDEEGKLIKPMPADYGFRSGSGRLYQQVRMEATISSEDSTRGRGPGAGVLQSRGGASLGA